MVKIDRLTIDNIIVISLSLSYFIYSSLFNLNYYAAIFLGLGLFGLMIISKMQNNKSFANSPRFIKCMYIIIIPQIILIIFSAIILLMRDPTTLELKKYFARSLLYITAACEGIAIVGLFRKKSIDILFKAAVINYSIIIFIFILKNGIINLIVSTYETIILGDNRIQSILEAHEITFVFGLFFIFYFISGYKSNKKKIVVCFIYMILGFKRIMIPGILVSIIFMVLFSKMSEKSKNDKVFNKIAFIMSIVFLFVSFIWLWAIKADWLVDFSKATQINFMGRIEIYELISKEYDVLINYFGKGLGYISYWGEKNANLTRNIALHNGIIQMYVENGCIMYIAYIIYHLYYVVKKMMGRNKLIWMSLFTFTIICWMTDNVASYFNYLVVLNALFAYLFNNSYKREGVEKI